MTKRHDEGSQTELVCYERKCLLTEADDSRLQESPSLSELSGRSIRTTDASDANSLGASGKPRGSN